MDKLKFQTAYKRIRTEGEVNDEASITVPGQTMSIAQMALRYIQGFEIPTSRDLYYDEDPSEDPMPRIKDLTDIDLVKQKIKNVHEKLKDARKTQNQQDAEKKQEQSSEK